MNDIYAYFDAEGILKERITAPVREGATGSKIYAYVEISSYASVTAEFSKVGTDESFDDISVTSYDGPIPSNYTKGKDLRYFDPLKTYHFNVASIPSGVSSVAGTWEARFRYLNSLSAAFMTGRLSFSVQSNGNATIGQTITIDQYDYLLGEMTDANARGRATYALYGISLSPDGNSNGRLESTSDVVYAEETDFFTTKNGNDIKDVDASDLRVGDILVPYGEDWPCRVYSGNVGTSLALRALVPTVSPDYAPSVFLPSSFPPILNGITMNGQNYRVPVTYVCGNFSVLGLNAATTNVTISSSAEVRIYAEGGNPTIAISASSLRIGDIVQWGSRDGIYTIYRRYVSAKDSESVTLHIMG